MAAPAAEVIPRRSSSGVFLGLSFRAMMCVIASVGVAVFATPVFGGFRGLAITAPVWLPLLVLGLWPVAYIDGRAIDWLPIGVSHLIRRATRQHQYRAKVWRTRPEGTLGLPGNRARLEMLVDEASGTVMVLDRRKKTLAVTAAVQGSSFLLDETADQNAKGNGYGRLLSVVGSTEGIKRIQVRTRSTADVGADIHRYWVQNRAQMNLNHPVQASYRELLAWSGTFMERHEATITIVLDLEKVKKSVRAYGGGKTGAAALMRQRMSTLEQQLDSAGLTLRGWLTKDDLATIVRCAYDPAAATRLQAHPEQVEDLEDAGPMAVDPDWTQVRTDSGFHKVMRIAKWSREKSVIGFLEKVLLVSGIVVTASFIYSPVPSSKAVKDAQREGSREVEAHDDRRRLGRGSTVVNQTDHAQAVEHLADLNRGFVDFDHAVLLTVSAPTKEALAKGVEDVRGAARAVMADPRTVIAQQDELFEAAVLPLGLGVR